MKKLVSLVLAATMVVSLFVYSKAFGDAENALDLYVSPTGNDTNSGAMNAPFATIERARDEIRAVRSTLGAGDIVVHILEGEYRITESIVFAAEDSGTADNPVIYRGEGKAVLTGGITLDTQNAANPQGEAASRIDSGAVPHIQVFDLTALGLTAADWGKLYATGFVNIAPYYDGDHAGPQACELFYGGERMTVARYPNAGGMLGVNPISQGQPGAIRSDNNKTWDEIRNPEAGTIELDSKTNDVVKNWKNIEDVWLFGYFYYDWADMTTPVKTYDPATGYVTPLYASYYGYAPTGRFYLFNALEALDVPGEWYLDRESGLLYVYLPEGNAASELTLSLTTDDLICINDAERITFEGLTLCYTRGNGITSVGDDITVKNCTVTGIASAGVSMNGFRNTVADCEISRIGVHAIVFDGGDRITLTPSGNAARNNHIHDWAEVQRTYAYAVLLNGVGVAVANNEMHSAPHTAIWQYGNSHLIEYNEIYNVLTESDDAGAIFCGRDWTVYGTVIRYNYFHDIKSNVNGPVGGPFAIYFDDGVSGQTVYGNIFENVTAGVFVNGGRDCSITNNIFINVERKMIWYSDIVRAGFLDNTHWYACVQDPDWTLWVNLRKMPYQGEIWSAHYPKLAAVTTDASNIDDPNFVCNPAGALVENNITFGKPALCMLGDLLCGIFQDFPAFADGPVEFLMALGLGFLGNLNALLEAIADVFLSVVPGGRYSMRYSISAAAKKFGTVGQNRYFMLDDKRLDSYYKDGIKAFENLSAFRELKGLAGIPAGEIGRR